MVFNVFYDASSQETEESNPLVVAGLASTQEQWSEFERAWRSILHSYGVSHLHMRDYAHSRREFSEWKGNEQKRGMFLSSLIDVMKRTVMYCHVFHIVPEDYNAVNSVYHLHGNGWSGAYSLAALMCVLKSESWLWEKYDKSAIGHIIEKGDAGQHSINKLIDQMKNSHVQIVPKYNKNTNSWVRQFEACDFLAYEWYLAIKRHHRGENPTARKSFRELMKRIPVKYDGFDKDGLTKWCLTYAEKYPRRDGS